MMSYRLAPRAERDVDDIWFYIARESNSINIADSSIDALTEKFRTLAEFPYLGRSRNDLGVGARSLVTGEYVIVYTIEREDARILRVVHGRRDFERLFGR